MSLQSKENPQSPHAPKNTEQKNAVLFSQAEPTQYHQYQQASKNYVRSGPQHGPNHGGENDHYAYAHAKEHGPSAFELERSAAKPAAQPAEAAPPSPDVSIISRDERNATYETPRHDDSYYNQHKLASANPEAWERKRFKPNKDDSRRLLQSSMKNEGHLEVEKESGCCSIL